MLCLASFGSRLIGHFILALACCVVVGDEISAESGQNVDDRPEGWAGLGNTEESYVENGIDKSPIRGFTADGVMSSIGLGDDESFKKPKYADAFYSDPACDNAGDEWIAYRQQLSIVYPTTEEDEDQKALAAWQFFMDSGMKKFKVLDELANKCFLGVCATLYHISRHRVMVEGNYNSAVAMAKSLDRYVASIHPGKFDKTNMVDTGKPLWPVSDFQVGQLQRDIARASQGRLYDTNCGSEKGCTDGAKPLHGNIFHAMGSDPLLPSGTGGAFDITNVTVGNAFKIYVYDVADYPELATLASGAAFCKENQWGFEVLLHYYFLACDCHTDDPNQADFFFVPQYTACHLNVKTFEENESNAMFESLIPKLKHFKRGDGKDHLFMWGAGFAVDGPFREWRRYIKRSIFLMTETEYWNPYTWQTETNFNFAKDVLVPGRISLREIKQHNELAIPLADRIYIGDFVGWNRPLHTMQGKEESPRQRLLKWALKYPDMHIRQDVPYAEALTGSVRSRFCFVPRGKSAWSSRMFRTLYGKCVPVILNDDYELPFLSLFENKDNWMIWWPMREVTDELADFLRSFDVEQAEQMVRNAEEAKCLYVWHPATVEASHWELEEGDLDPVCPEWRTKNAYVAVMTLLYNKKRATKAGHSTFYIPGASVGKRLFIDENFNMV